MLSIEIFLLIDFLLYLAHPDIGRIDILKGYALQYALNAFQELHCMIYTLRRFVLANLCMTLSLMNVDPTLSNPYPHSPIKN